LTDAQFAVAVCALAVAVLLPTVAFGFWLARRLGLWP
jgi:hypothetical protein